MSTIDERRRQRAGYLIAAYELSEGGVRFVTHRDVARDSGIPETEIMQVGQYLVNEGTIKFETMGGMEGHLSVTHRGVVRAEELISEGQLSREVGDFLSDQDIRIALEPLLVIIDRAIDETPGLDRNVEANLRADVASANDQLRADEPNREVLRGALNRIGRLGMNFLVGGAALLDSVSILVRGLGH